MMRNTCVLLTMLAACAGAHATTVERASFEQLAVRADLIAAGTVTEVRGEPTADRRYGYTYVTLSDVVPLKGIYAEPTLTLRLDGGHLPTIRLHATLLAGAGDSEEAAGALEVWLARTRGNPLYSGAERADALLDLAALDVLLGEPGDALFVILDGEAVVYQGGTEVSRSTTGGYFGEMAILDGAPRSATVSSLGE